MDLNLWIYFLVIARMSAFSDFEIPTISHVYECEGDINWHIWNIWVREEKKKKKPLNVNLTRDWITMFSFFYSFSFDYIANQIKMKDGNGKHMN